MGFYPPTLETNWSTVSYSWWETNLIFSTFYKVVSELEKRFRPFVDTSFMYKDLRYNFTDYMNDDLRESGAIGLATRDWNLVYVPTGLSLFQMTSISGVMAMELAHSLWRRNFHQEDTKGWNDVIHYLENEGRLKTEEYVSEQNLKRFGGAIKVVIPDIAYAILNRKEIMAGIRSGKYPEGFNEYWADPAATSKESSTVLAHKGELELIKHWLEHGAVYGQKVHHSH